MRINAFYNESAPQILLEQIADYFVQAQTFYSDTKKYQKISVVPHGNWLYTGILQALSYTYLQQQEHEAYLLVTTNKKITTPITTNHKKRGTLRGREIEFAHKIISTTMSKRCTIDNKEIKKSQALSNQLPFIMLSKPLPIIPLIIPEKFSQATIKQIHMLLKKHKIGIITLVESLYHTNKETSLQQSKEIIKTLEQKKNAPS
jgi:AmmeMemoRadiSam system protein B